jgi:glycosyltransferase involved in cell wall biosynthesis
MTNGKSKLFVSVIIAALNEEAAIANVVNSVPRNLADEIIVVDNGSKDRTAAVAAAAGARVVKEPIPGYGRAFRAGLRSVSRKCEVVVFLDGDGSDCPEMMERLVNPISEGKADFVIGSRTQGNRESGSMNFHQVLAGYGIGVMLRILYGVRSTDMGPFRAIRRDTLDRLGLREETYGWPLEMQMRAARGGVRTIEVPVDYRRRAGGHSKIAGSLRGSVLAATRILITLARIAIQPQKGTGSTKEI